MSYIWKMKMILKMELEFGFENEDGLVIEEKYPVCFFSFTKPL